MFGIMSGEIMIFYEARHCCRTGIPFNNVDTYSENITYSILPIAKEFIPNRLITIRPSKPPWITTEIKRNIRKRKRAYRKAKSTGL